MADLSSLQNLYRTLLRHAERFPQYNYRNYALRKIKEEFADAKLTLKTSEDINKFLEKEQESLEQLKRMIKVQSLYFDNSTKIILENTKKL